jgi:hypothetical protein
LHSVWNICFGTSFTGRWVFITLGDGIGFANSMPPSFRISSFNSKNQLFNVRSGCVCCSYWWNCWPSLFKLSFHNSNVSQYNYITTNNVFCLLQATLERHTHDQRDIFFRFWDSRSAISSSLYDKKKLSDNTYNKNELAYLV